MPSMDEIYREHSKTIYRYLLSLTHDADVSEELTQETFYQAVKSIDRYDESCKMTTWLCAIAKNSLVLPQFIAASPVVRPPRWRGVPVRE